MVVIRTVVMEESMNVGFDKMKILKLTDRSGLKSDHITIYLHNLANKIINI
jgi:hypothetical protein